MPDSSSSNIPILIERSDGEIINAHHRKPKDKDSTIPVLIIMLHGFPKNQRAGNNFYGLLAETYAEIGFPTLQFDFTRCESANANTEEFTLSSAAEDMQTIFTWAEQEGYQHLAFIAEGLGASVLYANLPEAARFCILCWPALDLKRIRDEQFKADQHTAQIEADGYLTYNDLNVGKDILDELANYDLIADLHKAHAPTLILQGEKDTVITAEHLDIAREHLMAPRVDITTFDDGEHGLTKSNHRKACLHLIQDFSRRHSKYLPTVEDSAEEKHKESA